MKEKSIICVAFRATDDQLFSTARKVGKRAAATCITLLNSRQKIPVPAELPLVGQNSYFKGVFWLVLGIDSGIFYQRFIGYQAMLKELHTNEQR